mmetsp:Transcript_8263/g.26397  ORF Transcript_8263/g.26397 Transcript_8263/m.26397 type:complete len:365 (+) Transcript_8263:540-1634(+)
MAEEPCTCCQATCVARAGSCRRFRPPFGRPSRAATATRATVAPTPRLVDWCRSLGSHSTRPGGGSSAAQRPRLAVGCCATTCGCSPTRAKGLPAALARASRVSASASSASPLAIRRCRVASRSTALPCQPCKNGTTLTCPALRIVSLASAKSLRRARVGPSRRASEPWAVKTSRAPSPAASTRLTRSVPAPATTPAGPWASPSERSSVSLPRSSCVRAACAPSPWLRCPCCLAVAASTPGVRDRLPMPALTRFGRAALQAPRSRTGLTVLRAAPAPAVDHPLTARRARCVTQICSHASSGPLVALVFFCTGGLALPVQHLAFLPMLKLTSVQQGGQRPGDRGRFVPLPFQVLHHDALADRVPDG